MAAQQVFQPAETHVRRKFLQMVAPFEKQVPHLLRNFVFQLLQMPFELLPRAHHDFRGCRRCGRAHIRHKIRNREIVFVPHATHDGYAAVRNRAGHNFLVECPQVLDGPAAARQQDDVHKMLAVEILERRGDILRRAIALHAHRVHDQVQIRKAPPEDSNNVPYGRALWGRHHANAARQHGQRLLAPLFEQAFGFEALLELFERQLQRADAGRLDVLHVNLIFAARLVHADRSAHDKLQPVLGTELQPHRLAAEADTLHLGLGILQREIEMTRLR